MGQVRFDRQPYTVTYFKEGVKHTIRRRPPPKLHDVLPTDIVSLKYDKNIEWEDGDDFEVKHINPRHPNVLQLENDDGETTFVEYFDVDLEEMVAPRRGRRGQSNPDAYLLWP